MERTKTLKSGLRTATAVVFLAAAILSTGCSGNALLNPQTDQSAQSASTANGAGNEMKPAGNEMKP
jgi:hypothetical protein